ncbi:MAG: DUF4270 domain-containing protein [Tamlana sp.]
MKKTIKALKFPVAFLLILSSFIACDKDFNVIESDVLGKENSNFTTDNDILPIVAYNKKLDSLQINNLPSSLLGIFNDPTYGKTTASIVTQITPTSFNPDFGTNPVIDSVVINIPYYSTQIATDAVSGNAIYQLDSLYGDATAPIKLSIYQNNYFLRSFDPYGDTDSSQRYYSNSNSSLNSALTTTNTVNFDGHVVATIHVNDNFLPSSDLVETWVITDTDTTKTFSAPSYRVVFDKDVFEDEDEITFWKETIINKQDTPELSNSNNFNDYFRGIYFKAESLGSNGNMILLNLASNNANITIHYSKDSTEAGERTQSSYTLNFTGNRLNTFINDHSSVVLQNGDKNTGDNKLYIKGTSGSMAVIDLFPSNELENFLNTYRIPDGNGSYLKNSSGEYILNRLINEAQLVVYEDETIYNDLDENGNAYHKYDRIYAYDINNNRPTLDYLLDQTENSLNPLSSKIISLSQRDTITGKFKIRLTEHINNILLRDSLNTKIGLVLSTNVNIDYNTSNGSFNTAEILNSNDDVTGIPASALITPRGTILYGSNSSVPENKRLSLKLYYTELN